MSQCYSESQVSVLTDAYCHPFVLVSQSQCKVSSGGAGTRAQRGGPTENEAKWVTETLIMFIDWAGWKMLKLYNMHLSFPLGREAGGRCAPAEIRSQGDQEAIWQQLQGTRIFHQSVSVVLFHSRSALVGFQQLLVELTDSYRTRSADLIRTASQYSHIQRDIDQIRSGLEHIPFVFKVGQVTSDAFKQRSCVGAERWG